MREDEPDKAAWLLVPSAWFPAESGQPLTPERFHDPCTDIVARCIVRDLRAFSHLVPPQKVGRTFRDAAVGPLAR